MTIVIREVDESTVGDVNRVDGSFLVTGRLRPEAAGEEIRYRVEQAPPYVKRYPRQAVRAGSYVDNSRQAIFLAYAGDEVVGQVAVRKNWNGYAYVEDLAVDGKWRRQGIGRRLMNRAVEWAKESKLPGMMLETQDVNVEACRFYERLGFELGGWDRYLYKGLDAETKEVALFWYRLFE